MSLNFCAVMLLFKVMSGSLLAFSLYNVWVFSLFLGIYSPSHFIQEKLFPSLVIQSLAVLVFFMTRQAEGRQRAFRADVDSPEEVTDSLTSLLVFSVSLF